MRQHFVLSKTAKEKGKSEEPVKRLPRPESSEPEVKNLIQRTERRWA